MSQNSILNVRDGIQYDMHLHGSRFIVVEFAATAIIAVVVLLFSVNMALRTAIWPWWLGPWIVIDAGVAVNCMTVWLLARQIAQREGPHPKPPDSLRAIWLLPLLVVIPVVLPFLAWQQLNQ